MQQLSRVDAGMLTMESGSVSNHFAALMIYDQSTAPGGRITFKGVLAEVESRLHLARGFRQKMVRVPLDLDNPYWVEDPGFDLEYHVRHIALPKPGDWRQFCIQAARLHARPIDLSRPPWELYVIEGLENVEGVSEGGFAMVLKMHHAAVDGVSGAEMITALHELTPGAAPTPPTTEWTPDKNPSQWSLLARAGANGVARPARLANVWVRGVRDLLRPSVAMNLVRDLGGLPIRVPRTRFNDRVSPHRVVDARRFPLSEMKRIKNGVPGVTINDAALDRGGRRTAKVPARTRRTSKRNARDRRSDLDPEGGSGRDGGEPGGAGARRPAHRCRRCCRAAHADQ